MTLYSPNQVKDLLLSTISDIESSWHENDPGSAFSRNRKISFTDTMLFPMVCMNGNLSMELMDFFDPDKLPSQSAMYQRRSLIRSDVYRNLFDSFTRKLPCSRTFKGYRLIGCDGTRLNLPYNPKDSDTFLNNISGKKGFNQMHMTVFHDLLNDLYLDACFDYGSSVNEFRAFNIMMDRFTDDGIKSLFIADRGFASFNCYAHAMHNDRLFLIRQSKRSYLEKYIDADLFGMDNFDVTVDFNIIRRQKGPLPANSVRLPRNRNYDYLNPDSYGIDTLRIRIVKLTLDNGSSEILFTNLPGESFSDSDIRRLYQLRWGVETSFRTLKYAAELIYIHSLKKDLVLQEIFGKLTLYNFSSVIRTICEERSQSPGRSEKYRYAHNKSMSIKICVRFLKGLVDDMIKLVNSYMLPVKPGRSFVRKLRSQAAESFTYR